MAVAQHNQPIAATTPVPSRRARWLAAQPFDWALSALYLSVLATFIIEALLLGIQSFPWLAVLLLGSATIGLLALDRWEYWRYGAMPPTTMAAGLLLVRAALIESINLLDQNGSAPFLYLVLPFTATLAFNAKIGWMVGGIVWLRFMGHLVWPIGDTMFKGNVVENALAFPAGVAFVMAMASLISSERQGRLHSERLLDELEESHARLRDYAAQVETLTVTAERNRVAREIHDSLGHYLMAINIQIRKASAFRAKAPDEAAQALDDALRLSHNALDDVRRSVGLLRAGGPPLDLRHALNELVAPLRSGNVVIEVEIAGSEEGFPAAALMALYRGAQEGLTNIQRHAKAHRTQLTIHFDSERAMLTLVDDGVGFDPTVLLGAALGRSHGYGLLGIRERMELVGGTAEVTSTPGGGTRLELTVPKLRPDQARRAERAAEERRCW